MSLNLFLYSVINIEVLSCNCGIMTVRGISDLIMERDQGLNRNMAEIKVMVPLSYK